jgi:hypothetical protein
MLADISAALSSVKTIKEIIYATADINKKAEINMAIADAMEKLADAQSAIISSNNELLSLQAKVSNLEKQLTEIENWERESERYTLYEIGTGVFTYRLNELHARGEPSHHLCTACYGKRKKSILQLVTSNEDVLAYDCKECGKKTVVNFHNLPPRESKG